MEILKDLVNLLKKIYDGQKIPLLKSVFFGLGYSGIRLDNDVMGLCTTQLSEYEPMACTAYSRAGNLNQEKIFTLLEFALSAQILDRVLGISAINALSQNYFVEEDLSFDETHDIIDILKLGANDKVGMVGLFRPMVPRILKRVKNLSIVERHSIPEASVAIHEDPSILEESDKVIITATTLVNDSLEEILKHCTSAVKLVLLGPTASMLPDPFFKRGFDHVCGMKILDANETERIIIEGGGTQIFKKFGLKYTISSNTYRSLL